MTHEMIAIREDWREGDEDLIVDLHTRGYAGEGERFHQGLGPYVRETVIEADLSGPGRSRVWFAEKDGETVGCTAMVDRGTRGQLRWVVLLPEARGLGVGRALFDGAMDYAAQQGWEEVFLETTDGLDASMAIYRKAGFKIVEEIEDVLWHGRETRIIMTKRMPPAA